MKYAIYVWMVGLISSVVVGGETTAAVGWPKVADNIEHALPRASGAFVGTLEVFDVDKQNQNITVASGRIVPQDAVWGELPRFPIELGRQLFMHGGSGNGGGNAWSFVTLLLDMGKRSVPLFVLYTNTGRKQEILYVAVQPWLKPSPEEHTDVYARDFLAILKLEDNDHSKELQNALIDAVVAPQSGELLWSYALRKLYSLEDDPDRRFDLVLNERVQRSASSRRLGYAVRLLTRRIYVVTPKVPSREEMLPIMDKLLRIFETAPTANLAHQVLGVFIGSPARIAQFTDSEWDNIRARVRAVCDDPNHQIHKLDDEARGHVNNLLERLLGERDVLKPRGK